MRILARDVLEYVAHDHGLGMGVFLSEHRTREIARPRQIAMYVIRQLCPHLSYPEIGRRMGGRDHTTILHGVRKIEELMQLDPDILRTVQATMDHFAPQADEPAPVSPQVIDYAMAFHALCNSYGRAMRQAA